MQSNRFGLIWLLLPLLAITGYSHADELALTEQYKTEIGAFAQKVRNAKKTAPLRYRIEGKLAIEPREITPAMMANTDRPTPEEREAILETAEIVLKYQPVSLEIMRKYDVPSPMISLSEAFYTRGTLLSLELYHGKLTYGEYNTKARQLLSQHHSDIAQMTTLLQKEEKEMQMQALQLAIQREKEALRELQLHSQFLQTLQQGNRSLRCNKIEGFTYCNN